MRILGLILVVFIAVLQYRIWWGEGSVREINHLSQKVAEQAKQNDLLKKQNELLKKEILALRKNPQLLEEIAREKLGLVKPNETFYRIIPKNDIR
ncbi:FtsB family cell division protein [Aliikangiella sp. IMCC44359]|uniref:FtsB family cell division protein n=1 Tax=Aliikangiella sp. IMCC44359 TaxID=3459125 RepID=UPI00403B1F0C